MALLRKTVVVLALFFICTNLPGNGARMQRKKQPEVMYNQYNNLYNYLLQNYQILAKPVRRPADTLVVTFGIKLRQILNVNETAGWITTNSWQTMNWNDYNLCWNASDYFNVSTIQIPMHRVWHPDIVSLNNIAADYSPTFSANTVVCSNGSVTLMLQYYMTTSCFSTPKATEETCDLEFGSWAYNSREVKLVLRNENEMDNSLYTPNRDWELIGLNGIKSENYVLHDDTPSNIITYKLKMKRTGV